MTETEWQERYEIMSTKGRIWKRSELRKRASEMLKTLMPGKTPVAIEKIRVERARRRCCPPLPVAAGAASDAAADQRLAALWEVRAGKPKK